MVSAHKTGATGDAHSTLAALRTVGVHVGAHQRTALEGHNHGIHVSQPQPRCGCGCMLSGPTTCQCHQPATQITHMSTHLSLTAHHKPGPSTAHTARQLGITAAISAAGVKLSTSFAPVGWRGLPRLARKCTVDAFQLSRTRFGSCSHACDQPSAAVTACRNSLCLIALGCTV